MKNTPWKAVDKLLLMLLCTINLVVLIALYQFKDSYFYLDSSEFYSIIWNSPLFYSFFTPIDRFRPLNYMLNIVLHWFTGENLLAPYYLQMAILILGEVVLFRLSRKLGCKPWQACLLDSMLFTVSAAGEDLFTISKLEPTLLVCFLLFTSALWRLIFMEPRRKDWAIYEITIFLAMLCKETWFVIAVPLLVITVWTCFFERNSQKKMLLALGIFVANYLMLSLYRHFYILDAAYISDYQISLNSILSFLIFYARNNTDYFIIGALGLFFSLTMLWKNKTDRIAAFCLAVNLGGWAYLVGMCLWRMSVSYYIYPAMGFFILSLSILTFCHIKRYLLAVLCVLSCFTAFNNTLVAVSHIDLSKSYTQACRAIADNATEGDRVVIENCQYFAETVRHTNYWLSRMGCTCEAVGGAYSIYGTVPDQSTLDLWGTDWETFQKEMEENYPRENDFLLYIVNDRSYHGTVRCVNPAYESHSLFIDNENSLQLRQVSDYLITRTVPGFENGKLTMKTMKSGYVLYRVESANSSEFSSQSENKSIVVTGYYSDGWMGKELFLEDVSFSQNITITVGETFLYMTGEKAENSMTISVDDEIMAEIPIDAEGGNSICLNDYLKDDGSTHHVCLMLEETGCPAEFGSTDTRELGALISWK